MAPHVRLFDPVNTGLSDESLEKGYQDLVNFATITLSGLIIRERSQLGAHSSLTYFARLDIGVWEYEPNRFDFYVNEVTRGSATGLYCRGDMEEFTPFIDDLAASLPLWVDHAAPVPTNLIDPLFLTKIRSLLSEDDRMLVDQEDDDKGDGDRISEDKDAYIPSGSPEY